MKECSRCHLELSADHYYVSNKWTCISCVRARSKARYTNNKEECLAQAKRWVERNREKVRGIKQAYRERNRDAENAYHFVRRHFKPELVKGIQDKYRRENLGIYAAAAAKRRASLLQATPSWADFEAIQLFYSLASCFTEATGIPHEVDHFYPLQGEEVSGLHVPANLRVITRTDNRSKSNKVLESIHG